MSRFRHSIRKQTLEVDVDSEALALALQPRLGDVNRKHLLPIIERVLDELDVPGRHIQIARLEIDLGTLPLSSFEEVVKDRLYQELRRVLKKALREAEEEPSPDYHSQPEALARRELLEHYLLQGTLPFWAPERPTFSLEALFQELSEHDPQGLVLLLRRHGRLTRVLERIVAQLETPQLERLLGLLEPEHAALVIDYIVNLQKLHRVEPVLALSERAFSRVLWSLALGYVAQDPGTQFNRKSSVKSLLQGIAESNGLDYGDILTTLRLGLQQTEKSHPLHSSLPAVIGELVLELDRDTVKHEGRAGDGALEEEEELPSDREAPEADAALGRYEQADILRYYLRHGVLPWDTLLSKPELTVERVLASLPELPHSLLRTVLQARHPHEQLPALLRAVRAMPENVLAQLIQRLLPRMQDVSSPLRATLMEFAARSKDKPAFFARLLSAVLEDRPFDLEELAAFDTSPRTSVPLLPDTLSAWEAHVLESALVNRLRFGEVAGAAGHSPADLLEALIAAHPQEARQFLRALREASPLRSSLVEAIPSRLFQRMLELLRPDEAETFEEFTRAFSELPAPFHPGAEEALRQAIFQEVLRLEEGKPLSEAAFVRVLRKVFGASLPEPVGQALSRATTTWAAQGRLPAAHVSAIEAAIHSVSGRSWSEEEELHAPVALRATAYAAPVLREAVFAFLLGERRAAAPPDNAASHPRQQVPLSEEALQHALRKMIEDSPEEVHAFLRKHLADPRKRERWVKLLPESGLARLSHLLEPRKHRVLLDAAEVLASAWQEVAPARQPGLTGRQAFWGFLLEFLSQNTAANRSVERLVAAFFEHFAARYRAASPGATEGATVGERLRERASELARAAGHPRLVAILHRGRMLLSRPWEPTPPARREPPPVRGAGDRRNREGARSRSQKGDDKLAFKLGGKKGEEEVVDPIYLRNAGLVLTNPFLPHLFQSLDLLRPGEGRKLVWKDPEATSRAVHVLQYLVDGQTSAPEPTLALNKVLCGVPVSTPIEKEISLTEEERALCAQLLQSLIANWKVISNTSIAGLQETFLQREGRLHHTPEGWRLLVQRKTLDLLTDQLPWSISVVSHRWMPEPLYVTW